MERILALCLACVMLTNASCAASADETRTRLLLEHNKYRAEKGADTLVVDERLCEYAQKHADKMASKGLLVHSSMSNLAMVLGNGNVGENIAWGQSSEEQVFDSWVRSPGHRANITSKRFKKVGFGVKEDEKGRKYWCVVFSA